MVEIINGMNLVASPDDFILVYTRDKMVFKLKAEEIVNLLADYIFEVGPYDKDSIPVLTKPEHWLLTEGA